MKVAIIGASGEVGRMMLRVLEESKIKITELSLFASHRSSGQKILFNNEEYTIRTLTKEAMKRNYDYMLFSAGGEISQKFAIPAAEAGNIVIDNSSAFRKSHLLIIPEINGDLLRGYRGIVANPNCSTIQLALSLWQAHQLYGLQELIVTTLQSVSGAGNKGITALTKQRGKRMETAPFSRLIDLNVIPQIGDFSDDGSCEEETKMIFETKKIMGLNELKVSVTTVRVPVIYGHSESVYALFNKKPDLLELEAVLNKAEYIHLSKHKEFITPLEIGDSDQCFVSRLRKGGAENSLMLWNVAHNVRLGAATNAVNIMKKMMEQELVN